MNDVPVDDGLESYLEEIRGYLRLSDRLATAGQPGATDFEDIKEAGFEIVINLAVPESPSALRREAEIVAALGMEYIAIPVIWERPAPEDFERFCDVMDKNAARRVFIHCIANMRVSAFVYLHRVLRRNEKPDDAERDMRRIWTPNPVWKRFIEEIISTRSGASPTAATR